MDSNGTPTFLKKMIVVKNSIMDEPKVVIAPPNTLIPIR